MKQFLITLAVLAGLAFIGWLVYIIGFAYAYRNFAGPVIVEPKDAPSLIQYITNGRVERLENAIQQTIQRKLHTFVFKPGLIEQVPTLTIFHKGDEISYRLLLEDCHSLNLLDDYDQVSACGTTHLTILGVERNAVTVFDNYRNKPSEKQARKYKAIFEDSFFNSVRANLEIQPVYNWKISRSALHDTVLLDIYRENDTNDIKTRHVFRRMPAGGSYNELRTEKFYEDSTVVIEYDTSTYNVTLRSTYRNGKLFHQIDAQKEVH